MNSKKTRKALIGTFIGMMALTAASAATAGVAWFTTTRTATVSFPNAAVSSNRGELKVGKLGQAPDVVEYTTDEYEGKIDSLSSYDGVNFYNALLDVDGSELINHEDKPMFFKVEDGGVAEFGFSAGTQGATSNTDLAVYLEKMDIVVTNAPSMDEKFDANGTNKEFAYTKEAEGDIVVKVGGVAKTVDTDYTVDTANKKIVFAEAPAEGTKNVEIVYKAKRAKVADDDPILNSIRVSFFSSNTAATAETVAVADNQTLVWDTTGESEDHYGVTVTAEDATHTNEEHYIRKASERFIDLDYAIDANDTDEKITNITLKHGDAEPVSIASQVSVTGRRVTITDDELEIARGDLIKVTYVADTVGKKALANNPEGIDGYYAGEDLTNSTADGDLETYGAYLGQTEGEKFLNVVTRVWIEGTDAQHNETGLEYDPKTKNSIDISDDDYEIGMDLKIVGIDSKLA